MWHIYISIVVLFRGAYCIPVENSPCKVVIKRFGEEVKTLEVKWNSDIHLICDASCVGPGPQPGLRWFYRDKNQSEDIDIEKLFRSLKFQTYPTTFHRMNELVIRDFGPNEETDFMCKGAIEEQSLEAKVALIGTDCPLKYNFRCKLGNKCIDRGYLCNQNNECPDGEDEVGCIVTEAPPAVCTADQYKCANGECVDGRYRCDGQQHCNDGSDEDNCTTCRGDQFQCADGNCVDARMKCDGTPQCKDGSDERNCPSCPPNNFQCKTTSQLECVDVSLVCDGFTDCTDKSDEVGCPFRCAFGEFKCAGVDDCLAESFRCDGNSDCPDRSDEFNCTCRENQFQCGDGICIDERRRCDGTVNCDDKSDELACLLTEAPPAVCTADQYKCANGECVDGRYRCDGQQHCNDGSDEDNCTKPCEFQCRNGPCISYTQKCDGIPDCPDGDDEICELPLVCPEGRKGCKDLSKCIDNSQLCNGVQDCTDGGDEKDCDLEKKKIIISGTGINDDGDNGLLSTTDGVTDNTGEFTDTTTPFGYDLYA